MSGKGRGYRKNREHDKKGVPGRGRGCRGRLPGAGGTRWATTGAERRKSGLRNSERLPSPDNGARGPLARKSIREVPPLVKKNGARSLSQKKRSLSPLKYWKKSPNCVTLSSLRKETCTWAKL